jgi:hypothetical protein
MALLQGLVRKEEARAPGTPADRFMRPTVASLVILQPVGVY